MGYHTDHMIPELADKAGVQFDPALFNSICASSIAKELGLAEKLAVELRARSHKAGEEGPDLPELVHAMGISLSQQIDDHAMRLQSISRHHFHAMNVVNETLSRKIGVFKVICGFQALCLLALLALHWPGF